MKNAWSGFTVGLVLAGATTALAGKAERDKQAELKPRLPETQKAVHAACGCSVQVSVKWDTYKSADDMNRIANTLEALVTAAKTQCDSPDNKKALCANLKAVDVSYNKDGGSAVLKGKSVSATSSDMGYTGDNQFTDIFSKF